MHRERLGASLSPQCGSTLWPSSLELAPHQPHQMMDAFLWDACLSHQVGRIFFSHYFVEVKVVISDTLLYPHNLHIQVPDLA